MAGVEIRLLAPPDAAAYRALRLRALREHPDAFTSSHDEDERLPLSTSAERLASSRITFWGAFLRSELCGMVGLERETRAKNRHKATVVAMYVAPEAAGHGIGASLLAALIAECRAEGIESLVLTVTDGNDKPRALYEKAGFRSFGVEPRAIKVGGTAYAKNHMHLDLSHS
ncbi:GNAT family N-acetyltransferase [Caenimonas sedimenti]|uniref:GNAT family N-acetyltransferase n=1 Tax=Caenimonas sedimenti TaxID=2596921 RepID=A0A562ZRX1_9BURK|nr:GNAT family N-acetyltransferase [Caenimonas sedimenti]TWO70904.1 GNAT family N-acetyltransferase [Caenimonas sedimenti]